MRKVIWWSGIGGVLIVCLGILGWFFIPSIVMLGVDTDSPTRVQIEVKGRFKLPPSARDLTAHLEGFQDYALWARFKMAPGDEEAFWASTSCASEKAIESGSFYMQGVKRAWWQPQDAKRYTFRERVTTFGQKVLIDKTDTGEYVVYVETFEM